MAHHHEIQMFERLSAAIGPRAALTLCAFAGKRALYLPTRHRRGHILERLLGEDAFLRLIAAFGGETLDLPGLELKALRRAGAVWALRRAGVSIRTAAALVGITASRARQICAELQIQSIPDDANDMSAGPASLEV